MKTLKVIIAGGGTGGHIFPAIAIANALKRLHADCEILFVGSKGKMEMEKVPKEGYNIIGLDISGFNRSSMLKNISLPYKLLKSFLDSKKILKDFKPDAVVGVGGYASFPVLYMAQQNGIPTLLQEQNSFAGKANKILGKKAKAVSVAYDNMQQFFPNDVILKTGNPVRASITSNIIEKNEAALYFKLDVTKKVVFVFGGSLGAKTINEAMATGFQDLVANGMQVIWQTGKQYYAKAIEAVRGFESQVKVFEFIRDMDIAYSAADVIVSRAGASSIAELCIVGKPVVFIPFPFASEDHQTHNAMALVKKNAAIMISDANCKQELITKLKSLIQDEKMMAFMRREIKSLAITNSDEVIANKLIELSKRND